MSNNDSIFQIRGLKTQFFTSKGIVPAVDGVDITVKKGEAVGLVGESGCGKSMTAMSTMQLLQYPGRVVAGEILLDGENLLEKTKKEMDEIRGNRITMIFQEPMTSLNPVYTIGKQVSEAILIHENVSKEEAKQRTIDIFRKVGIPEPEKRYNVFPHQLSGGLRQRVMIGMAIGGSANFTTSLPSSVFGRHGFNKVNSVLFPLQGLVTAMCFAVNGIVLNLTGSLRYAYIVFACIAGLNVILITTINEHKYNKDYAKELAVRKETEARIREIERRVREEIEKEWEENGGKKVEVALK